MGTRLVSLRRYALLAMTCLLLMPVQGAIAGQRPDCLECHPAHYAERGACTACHRGNPATRRTALAHDGLVNGRYARFAFDGAPEVRWGEQLLDRFACRRCHRIGGRGNRLAANLDRVAGRSTPAALLQAIRRPAGGMPDFRTSPADADDLVVALLAKAAVVTPGAEPPRVVHFRRDGVGDDLFGRKCGGCHRLLSSRFGALGLGDTGPNLSGLLSPFHPATFAAGEPWDADRLGRWLENPRRVRPGARMQPQRLTPAEFARLLDELAAGPPAGGTLPN